MSKQQKEDFRVLATVSLDESHESISGIVCKVYLPKRTTEVGQLIFLPNDEQEKRLRKGHLVNVHAELTQPNGDINIITSRQTLITKHKRTGWGPNLTEHVIPGEPWELQIETIFQNREKDCAPETEGHFWLSRNQLLSNVWEKSFSFTGEVKVGKLDPLQLTLADGLSVSFTEHSRYLDWDRDDTLMFEENVAEFQVPGDTFGTSTFTDSLEHIVRDSHATSPFKPRRYSG